MSATSFATRKQKLQLQKDDAKRNALSLLTQILSQIKDFSSPSNYVIEELDNKAVASAKGSPGVVYIGKAVEYGEVGYPCKIIDAEGRESPVFYVSKGLYEDIRKVILAVKEAAEAIAAPFKERLTKANTQEDITSCILAFSMAINIKNIAVHQKLLEIKKGLVKDAENLQAQFISENFLKELEVLEKEANQVIQEPQKPKANFNELEMGLNLKKKIQEIEAFGKKIEETQNELALKNLRKAKDLAERLLVDIRDRVEGEEYNAEEQKKYPLHYLLTQAEEPHEVSAHFAKMDAETKARIVQQRNTRGYTPLDVAIMRSNPEIVKALFKIFPDSLEMSQERALEKQQNMNSAANFYPEASSPEGRKLKEQKELEAIQLEEQKKQRQKRIMAGYTFKVLSEEGYKLRDKEIYISENGYCEILPKDPNCESFGCNLPKGWIIPRKFPEQLADRRFQRAVLNHLADLSRISYSVQQDWQVVLENLCSALNEMRDFFPSNRSNIASFHEELAKIGVFYENGIYLVKLDQAKNTIEYRRYICDEYSLIDAALDHQKSEERRKILANLHDERFRFDDSGFEVLFNKPGNVRAAISDIKAFSASHGARIAFTGIEDEDEEKAKYVLDEQERISFENTCALIRAYETPKSELYSLKRKDSSFLSIPHLDLPTIEENLEKIKSEITVQKELFNKKEKELKEIEGKRLKINQTHPKQIEEFTAELKDVEENIAVNQSLQQEVNKEIILERKNEIKRLISEFLNKTPRFAKTPSFLIRFFRNEADEQLGDELRSIIDYIDRYRNTNFEEILKMINEAFAAFKLTNDNYRFLKLKGSDLKTVEELQRKLVAQIDEQKKDSSKFNVGSIAHIKAFEERKRLKKGKIDLLVAELGQAELEEQRIRKDLIDIEAKKDELLLKHDEHVKSIEKLKIKEDIKTKETTVEKSRKTLEKHRAEIGMDIRMLSDPGDLSALSQNDHFKTPVPSRRVSEFSVRTRPMSWNLPLLPRSQSVSSISLENDPSFFSLPAVSEAPSPKSEQLSSNLDDLSSQGLASSDEESVGFEDFDFESDNDADGHHQKRSEQKPKPCVDDEEMLVFEDEKDQSNSSPEKSNWGVSPTLSDKKRHTFLSDKTKRQPAGMQGEPEFLSFSNLFNLGS